VLCPAAAQAGGGSEANVKKLSINHLQQTKRPAIAIRAIIALGLLTPLLIHAGDKIEVPKDTGKALPNQEVKGGNDLFKSWNRMEKPGFEDAILGIPMVPQIPRMTREEEKKWKNTRDEKKNWILLSPGELQRKDDEENASGGRKYSLRGFDKDDKNRDYTFYGVGEKRDDAKQRQPGETRLPGQLPSKEEQAAEAKQQAQLQREREEGDDDRGRESRTFSLFGTKDAQPGVHTSTELSFNKLFSPADTDAAMSRTTSKEFTLRDVLGGGVPTRNKDQEARRVEFNNLISGSPLGMASPLSISPAMGGSVGGGPGMPKLPDPVSKPTGNDLFGNNGAMALPNRLSTPGLPTLGGVSGFSSPSAFPSQMPAATPQSSSRDWMRSTMEAEPARRKF
jgi:hypothetical protein